MSTLIFAIWGPRYMKFWLWAYILVLSSMQKNVFQNFDFKEGPPYGPVLKINPFQPQACRGETASILYAVIINYRLFPEIAVDLQKAVEKIYQR